jgi:hypothetical protein
VFGGSGAGVGAADSALGVVVVVVDRGVVVVVDGAAVVVVGGGGVVVVVVVGATVYETCLVVVRPVLSLAVTVNVLVPADAVSTGLPSATVPAHVAIPDPVSAQA